MEENKTAEEKDLSYWKSNAEEDYMRVPISVLRYITELESKITQQQETIAELKNQLDGIKKQRQDDMSLANAAVIEIAELRKEVEWLRNEHADSSKRDAELKKQNDELMEVVKKANALIESLKLRITQHVDIKRRDRSLGLSLELFRDELNKIESYQNTPPKN